MNGLRSKANKSTSKSVGTNKRVKHLLAVGPLPPPPSGANVSFQLFCEHVADITSVETLSIIDTSPKRVKDDTSIFTLRNLRQAARTLWQFWHLGRKVDAAIIFGSNQFLLSLVPILTLLARVLKVSCFVRSFGGSLDQFCERLHPLGRKLLLGGFRQSAGLMVETKLLYRSFHPVLDQKVHYVTAYRPMSQQPMSAASIEEVNGQDRLRLVFVSWVREEKGVSTLLEALTKLSDEEQGQTHCLIYGPVVSEYQSRFDELLRSTSCAAYGGTLANSAVLETLQGCDVLVFPTYYQGEGYPGIIVESMMAGIPVITTNFRSIPDMITDGENGLLIDPGDSDGLVAAIRLLMADRQKAKQMGAANHARSAEYDMRRVLPELVRIIESST